MIVERRYVDFMNSLEKEEFPYLEELEKYALDTDVPIIRKEMQSFLKTLITMNKPRQILEVGTAIGFSALLMSEYMPADAHITTIEKYEKRIPIARDNFSKYGKEQQITLIEGDAADVLAQLLTHSFLRSFPAVPGRFHNFDPFLRFFGHYSKKAPQLQPFLTKALLCAIMAENQ